MDKSLVTKFFGADASCFCNGYLGLFEYLIAKVNFNALMKSAGKDEDLYRSQVFDYYHVSCFADLYKTKGYSILDVAEMFKLKMVELTEDDLMFITDGLNEMLRHTRYSNHIKKINDCYDKNIKELVKVGKDDTKNEDTIEMIDILFQKILKLCDKLKV